MQATADSKMVRIKGEIKPVTAAGALTAMSEFPNKVIKRCPAIKLAVSRTHKVMGRIRFLVISITTIKDISAAGVP